MSKLNQTSDTQSDKKGRHKQEISTQSEKQTSSPLQNKLLENLSFSIDAEGQANLLRNPKLPAYQRQAIAQRIGQVQGNLHLRRLISPITKSNNTESEKQLQRVIELPTIHITGDPQFYSRALRNNQRYAANPPQEGWPYDDQLLDLWLNGAYDEFAEKVRDLQENELGLTGNDPDGILGPLTARRMQSGANHIESEQSIGGGGSVSEYHPTRPRLSDPEVVSATALGAFVRLTFNMTWTRDEAVSFLWPNGPNPDIMFFRPDESDPYKTDAGEYQRYLIVPNSFVLQGIRPNVYRMIYESIPEFNAQVELPDWVPDEIKIQIQGAFTSEEDIHLYGRWPEEDDQNAEGLYWMQRRGSRTQIEVAQLPDPLAVQDRQSREARVTVNQYITSYVLSEGMSITEAKVRTRERTRRELVIAILEAIQVVLPNRIPGIVVPRSRPSISVPRVRPPRSPPPPGRVPRPTRLGSLVEQARDMVRRIRQAGNEVVVNMGGAGASHEPPGAININNQAVGRRGIPNHIEADASDIGQLFEVGSIDQVVGHHMAPSVIDWQRAVPGVRNVLRPGGTFRFDWRGNTLEAAQVEQLLQEAGFLDIRNFSNAVVTAISP